MNLNLEESLLNVRSNKLTPSVTLVPGLTWCGTWSARSWSRETSPVICSSWPSGHLPLPGHPECGPASSWRRQSLRWRWWRWRWRRRPWGPRPPGRPAWAGRAHTAAPPARTPLKRNYCRPVVLTIMWSSVKFSLSYPCWPTVTIR